MFWGICQFLSGAHKGTFDPSSHKKPQRQDVEERTGAGREGAKTVLENFQSAELVTDAIRGRQISSLRAPPVFKNGCNSVRTVAGLKSCRYYVPASHPALELTERERKKSDTLRGDISAAVMTDGDDDGGGEEDELKEIKVMDGMLSGYFSPGELCVDGEDYDATRRRWRRPKAAD